MIYVPRYTIQSNLDYVCTHEKSVYHSHAISHFTRRLHCTLPNLTNVDLLILLPKKGCEYHNLDQNNKGSSSHYLARGLHKTFLPRMAQRRNYREREHVPNIKKWFTVIFLSRWKWKFEFHVFGLCVGGLEFHLHVCPDRKPLPIIRWCGSAAQIVKTTICMYESIRLSLCDMQLKIILLYQLHPFIRLMIKYYVCIHYIILRV